jgi:hypothetical protein
MSKEQEQIIDEAYLNYSKNHFKIWEPGMDYDSKESFINKIKTDPKFSEKWRLHIEERELSLEERYKLANINGRKERLLGEPYYTDEQQHSLLDELVPTKLITLTYNNQKIETYE